MVAHKDKDEHYKYLYDLSFGIRPEYELFDMVNDPWQLHNLAYDPAYAKVFKELSEQLNKELKATDDPRVIGCGAKFDHFPYTGWGLQYIQNKAFLCKSRVVCPRIISGRE